jgi:transcriptional regulator with XRE-family HTH domain
MSANKRASNAVAWSKHKPRLRDEKYKAICKVIGDTLYDVRHELGMSQEEAAAIAEIDRTYPSLMERGLRQPTLTVFVHYIRALKADPPKVLARLVKELDAQDLGFTSE